MMKKILFLSIMLFCIQKGEAQFTLPLPQGWSEGKRDPKVNVPKIPYKADQAFRFTPGYLNTASDEYLSFVFLWYIDGQPDLTRNVLEDNLTNYFTDLYHLNVKIKNNPDPAGYKGTVKLELISKQQHDNGDRVIKPDDPEIYEGTVVNLNYVNGQNDKLLVRIHVLKYPGTTSHTAVLVEVSLVGYWQTVWTEMDAVVNGFKPGYERTGR
jgi:hypothetical protein